MFLPSFNQRKITKRRALLLKQVVYTQRLCIYQNSIYIQMKGGQKKGGGHLQQIKKIEKNREERRLKMQQAKREKQEKKNYNLQSGKNVDIDFELMIEKSKFKEKLLSPHISSADLKLAVCVRKRPIFKKEEQGGEIDSISCANPQIKVHQPKYKVDGITKYVENHTFTFDNTFNQQEETVDLYKSSMKPLLGLLVKQGIVTCFAYGQTGSGKTYTMNGLQELIVQELFELTKKNFTVIVSIFEIYGGKCLDLLNEKTVLNILEDKNGNIQIPGLTEKNAENAKELLGIMQEANANRTTHATAANDTSSRSHAICQVQIKKGNEDVSGKLVLVDLAGSQRAQDTQSNNRQRRMEGAEINKSLLALKECIRAMDDKADHVPFRASKLTLILRDSFITKTQTSKIVMIACISPGSSSADHSLNTLRYAERLKDQTQLSKKYNEINDNIQKKYETQTRGESKNSIEVKKESLRQNIQKIQSAKAIKKQESNGPAPKTLINGGQQNMKQVLEPKNSQNKMPPKSSNTVVTKKEEVPQPREQPKQVPKQAPKEVIKEIKELPKEQPKQNKEKNRANSIKKTTPPPKTITPAKQTDKIQEEIQIQDIIRNQNKKKVRQDISAMKRTMRGENKQQFFAFQEKVTSVLEEQEQVFATHMAAIKQDAKLLTQESELISTIQGIGFMDYDVDSYVDKLEVVIKKKLKMYELLSKKVQNFKKYLKEEDEVRQKVKNVSYY